MGRTIHAGSHVLLDEAPHPRIGEIWAWCSDDDDATVVVHRALGRGRDGYRFQGDGRLERDPPVTPDRIIGRVRQVRYGDHLWRVGWRDRVFRTARLLLVTAARDLARRALPAPVKRALRPFRRLPD